MRVLGGLAVVASVPFALALWLVVKETAEMKIAVAVEFVIVDAFLIAAASIAAASSVAKVREGRLEFFFCGVRTRSFALDANTTFDLHRIGRLEVLRIQHGRQTYVPNGALDRDALIDLLRTTGVAERNAD